MLRLRRVQTLSGQVLLAQISVLVVVLVAGFLLAARWVTHEAAEQFQKRALAVATSVAAMPIIGEQVSTLPPGGPVQAEANNIMRTTRAAYVVVTNAQGIRYSHPNPRLIGYSVTYHDPEPVNTEPFVTGRPWVGIQRGTLGLTARGKAPIYYHGRLVGEVSVGFPIADAAEEFNDAAPLLAAFLVGALLFGVLAAVGLARRLKRQTRGLELREIAFLLEEREALLHGIQDGVLGYDNRGKVLFANDSVRDMLGLPTDCAGQDVTGLFEPRSFAEFVVGASGDLDERPAPVSHGARSLTVTRRPLRVDHRRQLGWIVTFHDRTEPETLLRELDRVTSLADTLRAQSHEFANQLHTFVGLLELGQYDEAKQYVTELSAARIEMTERLRRDLVDSRLVALLLAKTSLAEERHVMLTVSPESRVRGQFGEVADLLTVVGNLVDNAIDATSAMPEPRWVEVLITSAGTDVRVTVSDNGPGVAEPFRGVIFEDGFTTKTSAAGARRGTGLALVHQVVERRAGTVTVTTAKGAVFTVVLPRYLAAAGDAGAAVSGALA